MIKGRHGKVRDGKTTGESENEACTENRNRQRKGKFNQSK